MSDTDVVEEETETSSNGREYITVTALKHGGTHFYDVPANTVIKLTREEAKPLLASGAIKEESHRERIVREALEAEGLEVTDEPDEFSGVSLNDLEGNTSDNTLPDAEPE